MVNRDLQLGDEKVTKNHLVYFDLFFFVMFYGLYHGKSLTIVKNHHGFTDCSMFFFVAP